jgi:Rieske Fe-S protein
VTAHPVGTTAETSIGQHLDDPRITAIGLLYETVGGLDAKLTSQLAEHGLASAEFEVLIRIARTPGQALRMTDLAAQTLLTTSGIVDESFKKTPAGGEGFWIVNLQPDEDKLVALSTICTHLGCIPEWKPGDLKYKCPCHGSGYYKNGINFEGPTPRPLERFAISLDADGYVVVDQTKIYRQELAQWDAPESFIALG